MPGVADIIAAYDRDAEELVRLYELHTFEELHADALPYIPQQPSSVLDVGAGSGRDAAWFAAHGHDVVAVEPAARMRGWALRLHGETGVRWVNDRLPELTRVRTSGRTFDLIWLSAVWMHLSPRDRERALDRLATLLRPGGRMMLSLRHGPAPPGRPTYAVSCAELDTLARRYGLSVLTECRAEDCLGREGVWWEAVVLERPPTIGERDRGHSRERGHPVA